MAEINLQDSRWEYGSGESVFYGPVSGASLLRKWLAGWLNENTQVRSESYTGSLSGSSIAKSYALAGQDRKHFLVSQFLYPELIKTNGPYDRASNGHISFVDPAAVQEQPYRCDSCDFEKRPSPGPSKVNVYFGGDVFIDGDWRYGWCNNCDDLQISTFFRASAMQSAHQKWAADFYRWLQAVPTRFDKKKNDRRIVRDQSLILLDERLDVLEFLDQPYECSPLCIKCGGDVPNILVEGDFLDPHPIKHTCGGSIFGHYRNLRVNPKEDFLRGTFENGELGWVSTLQLRERSSYARLLEDKILALLT